MSKALEDIAAERTRQMDVEGWTTEHDDMHYDGSLADAAACYAATVPVFKAEQLSGTGCEPYTAYKPLWPRSWADHWWKPKDRRYNLVRSAALIVAEIERLDRSTTLREQESKRHEAE